MSRRKGCAYIWERKDSQVLWLCRYVDKKPIRLSTGLKDTKQNRMYLNRNAEKEFWRIALEKGKVSPSQLPNSLSFPAQQPDSVMPTLREYGEYVLEATSTNRSAKTQEDYIKKFDCICLYFGDDKRIDSFMATEIAAWQSMLAEGKVPHQKRGYSSKTIINYRAVLSYILNAAVDDGLIERNPMESRIAKPPRIVKSEPNAYSINEIKALLEACRYYAKNAKNKQTKWGWMQMSNMLEFGFFTGLRSGELIALKWSDINFDKNFLIIRRRIRDGEEALPKGYKQRRVDLTPQAKKALKAQQFLTGLKSKWVWLNYKGKPYTSTDSLDVMFKKACEYANVRIGRFNNMRHTFITLMMENGMSESWITQNVGHVDISTTRNFYTGRIKPDFSSIEKLVV